MPVVDSFLDPGDPSVQASGERRGTINVDFGNGRVVRRSIRAQGADAWAALLLEIEDRIEREVRQQDAEADIEDAEIEANGEASIAERAVAYLRDAMERDTAIEAYRLMVRFDNYRQSQGWSWNQVATNLMSAGLEQEEFDAMRTAYQYLSGGGRPAIMAEARDIQENWENQ